MATVISAAAIQPLATSRSLGRWTSKKPAVPAAASRPFTPVRPAVLSCRAVAKSQHTGQRDSQPGAGRELQSAGLALSALIAPLLLGNSDALAVGGALGPALEGRTVSLLHPITMFALLLTTGYTGLLGWKWRRTRLIPAEIKALKAQLPAADAEGNVPASPVQEQITKLEQTRKELSKGGNLKEKHNSWGSLILGLGVIFGLLGPLNTYFRTGKLFPGPHLYAGGAIVGLWALAASMVPLMGKGNDTARNIHIASNVLTFGLFLWQVPTGLEIVYKVFEFTQWP